jgi:hypothetical protein
MSVLGYAQLSAWRNRRNRKSPTPGESNPIKSTQAKSNQMKSTQ